MLRYTLRLLIGTLMVTTAAYASAAEVLVFAAASLKPALDEIVHTPAVRALGDIEVSYAASSQLARQIEHGAPAALFISADEDWMDYLDRRGLIVRGTRVDLLGNALVLVAPETATTTLAIVPHFDLVGALGANGHLALAEPGSVPAGKYAKAALTSLGVWGRVEDRIVATDNVRAALNFVVRGEAPLGIVYRSDAVSEPAVRVVGTFPAASHPCIVYPAATVTGNDSSAARALLALLQSAPATSVFRRWGFDAPVAPAPSTAGH